MIGISDRFFSAIETMLYTRRGMFRRMQPALGEKQYIHGDQFHIDTENFVLTPGGGYTVAGA